MLINIKNIFLYALSSLVILIGLFAYWASREIPLPSNAWKVGDMIHIDISEGATDQIEKAEATFVVPEKFKPRVSDSGFAFYIKFPHSTPYSGNDFPLPRDQVRVVVRHYAKTSALPSKYILRETQPRGGLLKNMPYFVGEKNGMETYQYDYGRAGETNIGTYFRFVTKNGQTILVGDPGDWSRDYEVNRQISSHVGLIYLPPKKLFRDTDHFVEEITAMDNVVVKLVQQFQSK